jgi:TusA-related sulfurtransferase
MIAEEKKVFKNLSNIIEGLGMNSNSESVSILEDVGTNSKIDAIREMTSRALVKRNDHDALKVVITNKGKGINDMSTIVAMSTINELLALEDKTEAMKVLTDTIEMHSDEEVRDNARSVKALMSLS